MFLCLSWWGLFVLGCRDPQKNARLDIPISWKKRLSPFSWYMSYYHVVKVFHSEAGVYISSVLFHS